MFLLTPLLLYCGNGTSEIIITYIDKKQNNEIHNTNEEQRRHTKVRTTHVKETKKKGANKKIIHLKMRKRIKIDYSMSERDLYINGNI